MKCSVSSLIQRGDTDGVMDRRRRCVLSYLFRAMAVLYDRFRRRCPTAVRGLSLRTFGREVRSLGFPAPTVGAATAIGWWRCREAFGVPLWGIVCERKRG